MATTPTGPAPRERALSKGLGLRWAWHSALRGALSVALRGALLAATCVAGLGGAGAGAAWAQGMPSLPGHAAHGAAVPAASMTSASASTAACEGTGLACASAVTPHVDARGRLWLAWMANGAVSVGRWDAARRTVGDAVVVDRPGALLDTGADARVQIAVDAQGRVLLAWSVFKDRQWHAEVRLARSSDDGAHFSAPRVLDAASPGQRFPVLQADRDGGIFIAWVDKRPAADAPAGSPGASLAYAWTRDGGFTFEREARVPGPGCECCRLAVSTGRDGRPLVMARRIFGVRERDHGVFEVQPDGRPGAVQRVSRDRWELDGCPHHGPALAAAEGVVHAAWFTQGQARQGLFYARSDDGGRSFQAPKPIGDARHTPGRPQLLAQGRQVWLVWKEFDGQRVRVWLRQSADAGLSWTPDRAVAETAGTSDHPQLLAWPPGAGGVQLSWMTRQEGLRLLPLPPPPPSPPDATPIDTRVLSSEAMARLRQQHAGRPWVLHIWGLGCGPCLRGLPAWAQLVQRHPDLPLVLLQADAVPAPAAESNERLARSGLRLRPGVASSWTLAGEPDEFLRAAIDPSWAGSTPHTLLIAADGSVQRIQGTLKPEVVRRWWLAAFLSLLPIAGATLGAWLGGGAWGLLILGALPGLAWRRSMRRAISTSPSRVSSGTVPISRRYILTGSLVLSSAPGVRSSSSSSAPSCVRSMTLSSPRRYF